ncbi:PLDc N-terminal domain-containing protein [Microbacterium sp.]|uniref:PLDc N-terminal domain-containing protein n=1 Tax=Microbacterium sp. TaxID=51671 RepID=UPI0025EA14CA|nr:PLDc N-terminal domain-containing protein [Microbacterium sp.]
MFSAVNPLLPAAYDVAWTIVAVAASALTVIALVSLARAAKLLTAPPALVWVIIVLALPVVGAVAWLAVGRRAAGGGARTVG